MTQASGDQAKLRWRCRRGMRELDELLLGFVDGGHWQALDEAGQRAFQRLLEYPDQQLLEILMQREAPEDPALADMVRRIRAAVRRDSSHI